MARHTATNFTYSWDFGDGTTGSGMTVSHAYDSESAVEVTLTVRDQLGASDTATTTIYPANHTPKLTLNAPSARTYAVGDTVSLSATATDAEDGSLDGELGHRPATLPVRRQLSSAPRQHCQR